MGNIRNDREFDSDPQIMSWHYNYDNQTLTYIDSTYTIYRLDAHGGMNAWKDTELNKILETNLPEHRYTQVVGHGHFLVFSDSTFYPTSGEVQITGKVSVLCKDKLVKVIMGENNNHIGEYIYSNQD